MNIEAIALVVVLLILWVTLDLAVTTIETRRNN